MQLSHNYINGKWKKAYQSSQVNSLESLHLCLDIQNLFDMILQITKGKYNDCGF